MRPLNASISASFPSVNPSDISVPVCQGLDIMPAAAAFILLLLILLLLFQRGCGSLHAALAVSFPAVGKFVCVLADKGQDLMIFYIFLIRQPLPNNMSTKNT